MFLKRPEEGGVPDRAGASVGLRLGRKLGVHLGRQPNQFTPSALFRALFRASFHLFSKLVVFSGNGPQMPFGFLVIQQFGDGPSFQGALVPVLGVVNEGM